MQIKNFMYILEFILSPKMINHETNYPFILSLHHANIRVCVCATLEAQIISGQVNSYIDSVMSTAYGEEIMEHCAAGPFDPGVDTVEAMYQCAWHLIFTTYPGLELDPEPEYFHHGYDLWHPVSHPMCYNRYFDQVNTSYTELDGWRMFDGIRRGVLNVHADEQYGSYLYLPLFKVPKIAAPLFEFDLIPSLSPNYHNFSGNTYQAQNWNSMEIYYGEDDEKLPPGYLSTITPHGNNALRINNGHNSYHFNTASKVFEVDTCDEFLTFSYAMVMQDPNHGDDENPFFAARLYNNAGQVVDQRIYIADVNNSCYNLYGFNIVWRDWSCDYFDLRPYKGQTLYLDFVASDCGLGAHFGYAYVGDVCDTCCTPQIFVDLKEGADSLCKPLFCMDLNVGCQVDTTDFCIDSLPIDICDPVLHILEDGIDFAFPIPYDTLNNCYQVNEILWSFMDKTVGYFVTGVYKFNCDTMLLTSDTMFVHIPLIEDLEANAYVNNALCLYAQGIDPPVIRLSNINIEYPENFGWCDSSYIEWNGGDFQANDPWEVTVFSDKISLGGVFYVEDNDVIEKAKISGVIWLCDEEGRLCPFEFEAHLPGSQMCVGTGSMCVNWAYSGSPISTGWTFGYPQTYGGSVYYHKQVTLPFVFIGDCEITQYTINVYGVNGGIETLVHTQSHSNPGSSPNTLFKSVSFNLSTIQASQYSDYRIEITNNCGVECDFTIPNSTGGGGEGDRIGKLVNEEFRIGPNPTQDYILITYQGTSEDWSYTLYDLNGKIIDSQQTLSSVQSLRIDVTNYSSGQYFIKLVYGDRYSTVPIIIN